MAYNVLSVYFYSYAVITVSPTLTAVTVREPDLMAMIELNSNLDFEGDDVPITITYVTTDGTATGIDCILIIMGYDKVTARVTQIS